MQSAVRPAVYHTSIPDCLVAVQVQRLQAVQAEYAAQLFSSQSCLGQVQRCERSQALQCPGKSWIHLDQGSAKIQNCCLNCKLQFRDIWDWLNQGALHLLLELHVMQFTGPDKVSQKVCAGLATFQCEMSRLCSALKALMQPSPSSLVKPHFPISRIMRLQSTVEASRKLPLMARLPHRSTYEISVSWLKTWPMSFVEPFLRNKVANLRIAVPSAECPVNCRFEL